MTPATHIYSYHRWHTYGGMTTEFAEVLWIAYLREKSEGRTNHTPIMRGCLHMVVVGGDYRESGHRDTHMGVICGQI